VALHHSTLDGVKGAEALRDVVVGSDQLVSLALAVLPTLGVRVDDDYLTDP
jgi:multisubunit Na+/H+ antiporter MnhF subunit